MKYPKTTIFISLLVVFFISNYFINKTDITEGEKTSKTKTNLIISDETEVIDMLAFGDLMLGRFVETLISRGENMFENIEELMKKNKYILVNLEHPITTSQFSTKQGINLKMNPENIPLLQKNGINLVSLANNHIEDYQQQGIDDTLNYLDKSDIEHFGIQNQPLIKDENGIKLAFFGINALWGNINPYYKSIENIKNKVDHVIVSIHWGDEYESLPSDNQTEIGHKLIDSGATIILGHHPHTTQPVEKYQDGIIFYSLGNFIFDQLDPITQKELGVEMKITKNNINFQLHPMTVKNFKPELLLHNKATLECKNLTPTIELENICIFNLN